MLRCVVRGEVSGMVGSKVEERFAGEAGWRAAKLKARR
jgi:hypothetical protein